MATTAKSKMLAGLLVGLLGVAAGVVVWRTQWAGEPPSAEGGPSAEQVGTQVSGLPELTQPIALQPPAEQGIPTLIVDVAAPAQLVDAIGKNPWLTSAAQAPLGRGFLGAWAALFQTEGADLRASFKGTVGRFVAEQLLDKATRLVWMTGAGVPSLPALVVESPTGGARAAFAALSQVTQRGTLMSTCPHATSLPDKNAQQQPLRQITITRWLLADRVLYASNQDDRMVLAITPDMVVHGLCAELPPAGQRLGAVDVTVLSNRMGREPQLLSTLMGLGESTRLGFDLSPEHTLVPKGIAGTLWAPARLDKAPLGAALLQTLPEDAPVVVALQLRLPQELTPASLKAHFAGGSQAPLATRSVALVWYPHGSEGTADVALVWNTPSDRPALQAAFSGVNALFWKDVCGNVVLASTAATADHLARACAGQDPSLQNSAGAIASGLARPTSVVVGMHVGRLLAGLLRDAYAADNPGKVRPVLPPEVETAARQLLELPYMGLHGVLEGTALVPEGFCT